MTFWGQVAVQFLSVWTQPLYYAAAALALWMYVRRVKLERSFYGVKLHDPWRRWLAAQAAGIPAGLAATVLLIGLQIPLDLDALTYAWAAALLLALWRIRFFCFAYGGGLVGLLSLLARLVPGEAVPAGVRGFWYSFTHLQIPSLMATVAVLHLAEALLVRVHGARDPMPAAVIGRRGKAVGGFLLQQFWVVPLVVWVEGTGFGGAAPPYLFPWAGPGLLLAPMPAVLGYAGLAVRHSPGRRAGRTAASLLGYSTALLALSLAAMELPFLTWLPVLFAPLAHEWMIDRELREESEGAPRFVQQGRGVQVLAVVPRTPAEEMGIRSGDTILAANGRAVDSPEALYEALREHPAYVRLEVRDDRGETKLCSRSRFAGEPHLLGIIPSPGPDDVGFARRPAVQGVAWIQALRRLLSGRARTGSRRVGGDA